MKNSPYTGGFHFVPRTSSLLLPITCFSKGKSAATFALLHFGLCGVTVLIANEWHCVIIQVRYDYLVLFPYFQNNMISGNMESGMGGALKG